MQIFSYQKLTKNFQNKIYLKMCLQEFWKIKKNFFCMQKPLINIALFERWTKILSDKLNFLWSSYILQILPISQ